MAGEDIKRLAQFSSDGITQAMERLQDEAAKAEFVKTSRRLLSILGTPSKSVVEKKISKRKNTPTPQEIFTDKIVPQIRSKLADYEQGLLINRRTDINIDFDFVTDYSQLTVAQLQQAHAVILKQEKNIEMLDAATKFQRGMLYAAAYKSANGASNIADWFQEKLGVHYNTAARYIQYALLLRRYPRLSICGFTFEQLVKHHENICNFLEHEKEGLKERLEFEAEITAQGKRMKIECGAVYVPRLTFSTDPDASYIEAIEEVQEDDGLNQWFTETANNGELLFPVDSTAVMDEYVSDQVNMLTARTRQMTIRPAAAASVTSYGRGRPRGALQWSEHK